jgi:L-ribulose-5-phosphate 4-epimerase
MAIKPSGVDYDRLRPDDIVIMSLDTSEVVEGSLRPSTDAPTHLVLYRNFATIGGVIHAHSTYTTTWAQACREIPCLGTTHADHFHGPVPLTRYLTPEEIKRGYEHCTGEVIVERFSHGGLNPDDLPGVLLPGHGALVWGPNPMGAVKNGIILEEVAKMAFYTVTLNPEIRGIPESLLNKHYRRKHGPDAYYGQK